MTCWSFVKFGCSGKSDSESDFLVNTLVNWFAKVSALSKSLFTKSSISLSFVLYRLVTGDLNFLFWLTYFQNFLGSFLVFSLMDRSKSLTDFLVRCLNWLLTFLNFTYVDVSFVLMHCFHDLCFCLNVDFAVPFNFTGAVLVNLHSFIGTYWVRASL